MHDVDRYSWYLLNNLSKQNISYHDFTDINLKFGLEAPQLVGVLTDPMQYVRTFAVTYWNELYLFVS